MSDTAHLDTKAVSAWLIDHMPDFQGLVRAEKFAGGQSNPTFRLITQGKDYVLRRKPPGVLLKSAHAVDREFRVQKALEHSDVPVARMHLLCEDDAVIGSAFYVMDMVDGINYDNPVLPDVAQDDRCRIQEEMNRVLAAIHDVDIDAVQLSDFGPEGNYYQRQISRWAKQYKASETEHIPCLLYTSPSPRDA